jgi:predicted signal transduction protein with EAL and GGDEF domain/FixJ family two-component response regulator
MNDQLHEALEATAARVLLVDDNEVNLMLTAIALRERGFEVIEVNSGAKALESLDAVAPDMIVLDALMPPGIDGFETCQILRTRGGYAQIPVLMLTGLDDDASIERAYRAGATDFFVKSTQWSLLAGRLRYMLRASRTRIELERSKFKLARAQDLARMGSFDWKRGHTGEGGLGQLWLSPEALRVLGRNVGERLDLRALLRTVGAAQRRGLIRMLIDVVSHNAVLATDVSVTLFDGRARIIHVEAEAEFEHGQGVGYTGVFQDVTDRRHAEDRIRHLANFDALTGLPNRRQLIWRTERALEQARRLNHNAALLLIDLDRFKNVNDTLGHAAGDELLMEVARRLRSCVRHSEQVMEGALEAAGARSHRTLEAVGRLGGDEFVALLPEVADDADAGGDEALLPGDEDRVTQAVENARGHPLRVGIALFPRDGLNLVDLMRNSDVAMYAAKTAGRNSATAYSPHLGGRGREKIELESHLHKAIERNELVLYYQPKIDVRGAKMVGAEALMRWNRNGVLVPPGDFIPLAEETGLIVPLSEWAVREAARQAKIWQQSFGFADSIAVNLPSRLFERSDLVENIHQAVSAYGVPHKAIQLEITENNLMKDLHNVSLSLHRLNEIGVEISIDDFGTGYSSLAYLTTLPISELKIDRSFVRDLGITPQSSAVVSAIIALARSLGLRVIAEGVENLRQMEVLHRLGCVLMQGFLFAKALPPDDLETWLQQTVLPRKAPWIGAVSELEAGAPRIIGRGT